MGFDLQKELDETTSGFINIPPENIYPKERIRVNRPCVIQGCSRLSCRVYSDFWIAPGIDATVKNFRVSPPIGRSTEAGFYADNWFLGSSESMLVENFPVAYSINAGMGWRLIFNYMANNKFGVRVRNRIDGDQGDNYLISNTIDSIDGVAGVHYLSSGGLWLAFNKILRHDYSVLMEMEAKTSNLHGIGNSFELFKHWAVVGKLNGGSFENMFWVANELMSMTGSGFQFDGIDRGVLTGNTLNIPNGVARTSTNCSMWETGNNAVTEKIVEPPAPSPTKVWWWPW